MIISGIFPISCHNFGGAWIINHPSHTYAPGSPELINNTFAALTQQRIVEDSATFVTGPQPEWSLSPFNCVASGKPVPTPPDQFRLRKIKHSEPRFLEKRRRGEIVMNPYTIGGVWAKYLLGKEDLVPPTPVQDFTKQYHKMPTLFEMESRGSEITIKQGPVDYVVNSATFQVKAERRTVSLGITPYDVGWNNSILDTLLDTMAAGPEFDDDITRMITNVASEANMGTIDALTSVAELPEAIRFLIDTLKLFMRVFKDAKRKEFHLFNKKKRIQGLSVKEMSAINQAKAIKDVTDAIADVWLQFRYAIMPMVYTIEDAVKTNDSLKKEFLRFRAGFAHDIPFNITLPQGWTVNKTRLNCRSRILIKNGYQNGAQLSDLLGSNIHLTAWELIPLSFVVDWFINIGDFISSFNYFPPNWESKATFSWKIDDTLSFIHEPSNASVSVECKFYQRSIINPSDYCRLVYKPEINLVRQLDAFALIWKLFLSR